MSKILKMISGSKKRIHMCCSHAFFLTALHCQQKELELDKKKRLKRFCKKRDAFIALMFNFRDNLLETQ